MMLVELAVILAVVVFGFVYAWWSIADFTRRALHDVERHRRRRDPAEDRAWTHRQVECEHAITLALQRAELEKVEALIAALDRVERPRLDVVA